MQAARELTWICVGGESAGGHARSYQLELAS